MSEERRRPGSESVTAPNDLAPNSIVQKLNPTADIRVLAVLDGRAAPHDLPALLHDLWRDGFHAGRAAAHRRIDAATREADYWYFVANNPREARAERERMLREFQVATNRRDAAERWSALDQVAAERSRQRAV